MKTIELDDDIAAALELLLETIELNIKKKNEATSQVKQNLFPKEHPSTVYEYTENFLMKRMTIEKSFNVGQASDYINECGFYITKSTLYQFRTKGDGPKSYKLGKILIYFQSDIDEWLIKQKSPTPAFRTSQAYMEWKDKMEKDKDEDKND